MKLDDNDKSNFVYYNLEDKVRFDPEVAVDDEENEDKIKNKIHLDLKVKAIVDQLTCQRQVRSDIYI